MSNPELNNYQGEMPDKSNVERMIEKEQETVKGLEALYSYVDKIQI